MKQDSEDTAQKIKEKKKREVENDELSIDKVKIRLREKRQFAICVDTNKYYENEHEKLIGLNQLWQIMLRDLVSNGIKAVLTEIWLKEITGSLESTLRKCPTYHVDKIEIYEDKNLKEAALKLLSLIEEKKSRYREIAKNLWDVYVSQIRLQVIKTESSEVESVFNIY